MDATLQDAKIESSRSIEKSPVFKGNILALKIIWSLETMSVQSFARASLVAWIVLGSLQNEPRFVAARSLDSVTRQHMASPEHRFIPFDPSENLVRGGAEATAGMAGPTEAVAKNVAAEKIKNMRLFFQDMADGKLRFADVIFTILAVAAIGLSSSAMILEASLLVDVLAWTCIVVGSSAAVLQRKVSLLEGFRKITNQLRTEVNKVNESNDNLRKQNKRLAQSSKK